MNGHEVMYIVPKGAKVEAVKIVKPVITQFLPAALNVMILSAIRSPSYAGKTDDSAQAMVVVSGLASHEKYKQLNASLTKEYHASPYMEKYVFEALFLMGCQLCAGTNKE